MFFIIINRFNFINKKLMFFLQNLIIKICSEKNKKRNNIYVLDIIELQNKFLMLKNIHILCYI